MEILEGVDVGGAAWARYFGDEGGPHRDQHLAPASPSVGSRSHTSAARRTGFHDDRRRWRRRWGPRTRRRRAHASLTTKGLVGKADDDGVVTLRPGVTDGESERCRLALGPAVLELDHALRQVERHGSRDDDGLVQVGGPDLLDGPRRAGDRAGQR